MQTLQDDIMNLKMLILDVQEKCTSKIIRLENRIAILEEEISRKKNNNKKKLQENKKNESLDMSSL